MVRTILKSKVYIETSIIGYLASGYSRDLIVTSNQMLTRIWWKQQREKFDLYVSELVAIELGSGNPKLAEERLTVIRSLPQLDLTDEVRKLAQAFVEGGPLPEKASRDAVHIALATVHRMDYLLTWNCTHIANAAMQRQLRDIITRCGFEAPVICTPQELRVGSEGE